MATNLALALESANVPVMPPTAADAETIEIDSRFGRFAVPTANLIVMPHGLLGFSRFREYTLLTMPEPRFGPFKLLQCTTEPAVSFLVLPTAVDTCGVDRDDMDDALAALGFERDSAAVLLVVTVRKIDGKVLMTANIRAPILIDLKHRTARQFVLANSKYPIRQSL